MNELIQVKYCFKEYPNITLSKFFKTEENVDAFKKQHPNYFYVETEK